MEFQASANLPEQVALTIGERIIQNELKPGDRILEAKLADELGISRSPLREALRVLEKQKLVELIPRKGAKVTEITAAHIEWFYDLFEVLYGLVARKATEHATAEERQALRHAQRRIETAAAAKDEKAYYGAIFDFAALGMRVARNPLLEATLLDLWPNNRRIQFATLALRAEQLSQNCVYFQEMVAAMLALDTDRVEAVVKAYARNEKAVALKLAVGSHGGRQVDEASF